MAREFAFTDPSTKRQCEEDYVSPPWFVDDEVTSSAFVTGTSGSGCVEDTGGGMEIPVL